MSIPLAYTVDDAERAHDEWGANCGPGALAAITGLSLDEVRQHLHGFEQKRYTNPSMMYGALQSLGIARTNMSRTCWPRRGLVRVQWEGPWTKPGVPRRARYRHTHWIGVHHGANGGIDVFDINALGVGGWLSLEEWTAHLVPWLLDLVEPKADGRWHRTHVLELDGHWASRSAA